MLHGINFSPRVVPRQTWAQVTPKQIENLLKTYVVGHFAWIRTFGCSEAMLGASKIAHDLGLKVAGMADLTGIEATDARNRDDLIDQINGGFIDLAIVGGEMLSATTQQRLIMLMEDVRMETSGKVPVATNDTYDRLLKYRGAALAGDYLAVNIYPFWEGVVVDDAIGVVRRAVTSLRQAYPGKRIVIMETGWPTRGSTCGQARPSETNALQYLKELKAFCELEEIECFPFELADEPWKKTLNEKSFGLLRWDDTLKRLTWKSGFENLTK